MTQDVKNRIVELFQAIDNMDTEGFVSYLDDNVVFRFGNANSVAGKTVTGEIVSGFFKSIKEIKHDLVQIWVIDEAIFCHGFVNYMRHDSTTLRVPFANVFSLNGELIKEYLIFVDISELYKKM